MKRIPNAIALLVAVALVVPCIGQQPSTEEMLEYDRRLATQVNTQVPSQGFVPNAETAIAVAKAVATPVLGATEVNEELPLRAGLKDGVWTVIGTFKGAGQGGELVVQIDKKTGKILSLFHTQ